MAISDHITEYSSIDTNFPHFEIGRIITSLGLEDHICEDVVKEVMDIKQPSQKAFGSTYDPVTLLHSNHISGAMS